MKSGNFHHGYFLAGDFGVSREMALKAAAVIFGYPADELKKHPDFHHEKFDLFGVGESRELKERSAKRPFSGEKKVFIIELFSFTAESSNALLKLFEEPPEGTHFFVIIPSSEAIIPTLRSRLPVIESSAPEGAGEEKVKSAENFLKDSAPKRLLAVKKTGKDKQKALELLDGLEFIIEKKLRERAEGRGPADSGEAPDFSDLEQVQKAREFLSDRSANVKMILEHLALVLK